MYLADLVLHDYEEAIVLYRNYTTDRLYENKMIV